jgi:hypothetical protein
LGPCWRMWSTTSVDVIAFTIGSMVAFSSTYVFDHAIFPCIVSFGGSGYLGIEMCVRLLIETWHVSMGDRFQGSRFDAHVLWCVVFDWPKWTLGRHQNMTCFYVSLLRGPRCLCMETCVKPPQSEWHINNLSLK